MKRSGLADSPFFSASQKKEAAAPRSGNHPAEKQQGDGKNKPGKPRVAKRPSSHDISKPRSHDTTIPRYHDTIIEVVRKAVKEFGKEAATHRFTPDEKKAIADVIYVYKNHGIRTSENEIARIAVNFIINDYRENGKNSVLDRALRALNG